MLYASLIGPLLGVYYPLPNGDPRACAAFLNNSKLRNLWCSIYTEEEVNQQIERWGGTKLPDGMCHRLDYDLFEAKRELEEVEQRYGSG